MKVVGEKFNMSCVWESDMWYIVGKPDSPYQHFAGMVLMEENTDKEECQRISLVLVPLGIELVADADRLLVTEKRLEENWIRREIFKMQKDLAGDTVLLYNEDRTINHVSDSKRLLGFMGDEYRKFVTIDFSFTGDIISVEEIPEETIEVMEIEF